MNTKYKLLPFIFFYRYNNGFECSIKVDALNKTQALEKAKEAISSCYGSAMLKHFSFTS